MKAWARDVDKGRVLINCTCSGSRWLMSALPPKTTRQQTTQFVSVPVTDIESPARKNYRAGLLGAAA